MDIWIGLPSQTIKGKRSSGDRKMYNEKEMNSDIYNNHISKRVVKAFVCCMLVSVMTGCEELPFERNASREFIIRSGEHYATPRLYEAFKENKLAFRATFDGSARYQLGDPSLQSNINKLMGFSDCNSNHHKNSARFGWKWNNERVEIFAYCYVDGLRIHESIGTINVDEENLYEIASTEKEYVFFLNGERKIALEKSNVCEDGLRYMLYPYFGGSIPAPHDVHVEIEIIK